MKKEARLVFIPLPGVSHLVSAIEFAKLLLKHNQNLWITVLLMKIPSDTAYTDSLISFSERVQIIYLPETPSSDSPTHTFLGNLPQQKPHVREAVSNLVGSTPPVAAFVMDMFCTTMIDVAKEFNVPSLVFFTSCASFLGLVLHLHTLRENGNTEYRDDSQTEFCSPVFANPLPRMAFPSIALEKDWDQIFLDYGKGLKDADGIIVNSFQELESHAVHSFSKLDLCVPIYPVGPIIDPKPKAHIGSKSENTHNILNWLDNQPPSSVIFLCFGSFGYFGEDQVREIAHALVNSKARFLWALRKPPPPGSAYGTPASDYLHSDLAQVLPQGFLDRTVDIGKVVGWAPQSQILAHPATGGFVSHCGWNSTLESIYFGVPVATWPLYAEQQTNAFLLARELKIAVEIALDYRFDTKFKPNTILSAERIEKGIRSLLDMDEDTRKRVKEMSEKSRTTLLEGGSSFSHLGRLIDYVMNQVSL